MSRIVYNVTYSPPRALQQHWLHWLQAEHIPGIIATGCFTHAQVLRVRENDSAEDPIFAVQFYADSEEKFNRFIAEFLQPAQRRMQDAWGGRLVSFSTCMEVVD